MNPFWSPDHLPERLRDHHRERAAILHADRIQDAEERAWCEVLAVLQRENELAARAEEAAMGLDSGLLSTYRASCL